jgi:N-acetylneuraminate synthase
MLIGDIDISKKCFIIAEISANHNGSLERAMNILELASKNGADAVKLQTYTADTMTIDCDNDDFKIKGGLWDGYTLYELYKEAHTPWDWHKPLFDRAKELGITIFSTPFDKTAVDFLEELDTPFYKIASFEIVDIDLIEYIASKMKPIIISCGMANEQEIQEALEVIKKYHSNIILLYCVSGYPVPVNQMNLKSIPYLEKRFNLPIGLSDHSMGTIAATTAVALGAKVIEKHFTDSRKNKGPDSAFSLEPAELKRLRKDVDEACSALGKEEIVTKGIEQENIKFRRSLYFVKDMKEGDIINEDCIRSIRPGYGLPPKFYSKMIGKTISAPILRGTRCKD